MSQEAEKQTGAQIKQEHEVRLNSFMTLAPSARNLPGRLDLMTLRQTHQADSTSWKLHRSDAELQDQSLGSLHQATQAQSLALPPKAECTREDTSHHSFTGSGLWESREYCLPIAVQVPVCIAYSAKYTATRGTMYGHSLTVWNNRSPHAMSSALCCLLDVATSPSADARHSS